MNGLDIMFYQASVGVMLAANMLLGGMEGLRNHGMWLLGMRGQTRKLSL